MTSQRSSSIDLVRCIAMIMVFILHFIGFSGLYSLNGNNTIQGFAMFFVEQMVLICVPLFFICTGYLSQVISLRKAFKSIFSIYTLWVFYCLIYVITDIHFFGMHYDKISLIKNFLTIDGVLTREWYIQSYIMIMLFSPYFNQGWKSMDKISKRQILILLFVICTVLRTISLLTNNRINLYAVNYGGMFWPFLYFFVGKYVADYGRRGNRRIYAMVYFVVLVVSSLFLLFKFKGKR